jgi:flagellar protein FliL
LEHMGDFLVNLSDVEETHYLKTTIDLEQNYGSSVEFGNEIGNRKAQLRDIIISTLSSKSSEDLRTPEGKEALKEELKERINSVLAKGQIARIYFTDFAIQ